MAKHSFGVYLIHLPLMRVLQPLMPSLPYPLAHLALTVLTAVAAFVCAAVIDTLLVGPLQKAANLVWKRLSAH
jgi:peptidoglycan/LPS O-acetylase OafA/YrhL